MRYPDRPKNTVYGLQAALQFEESVAHATWIMQPKYDGFSTVVEWVASSKCLTLTSRHGKAIDASREMTDSLVEFFRLVDLPDATMHGEWMGRRASNRVEQMALFDLMSLGSCSMWGTPAIFRLRSLLEATQAVDPVLMDATWPEQINQAGRVWEGERTVIVAPSRIDGFVDHIRLWQQTMPYCEGVVFKEQQSRHLGSVRGSADNPLWTRLRWRGGEDGMTEHDL